MLDDEFLADPSGSSGGRSFLLPPTYDCCQEETPDSTGIADIVEELYVLEDEARAVDKELKDILKKIGY